MYNWKKILGFFFFSTLMFIKVSAFHVFTSHDDDGYHIENCVVCDMALDSQQTVLIGPDTSDFQPETLRILAIHVIEINSVFISNEAVHSYFSRPPPALLS